MHTLAKDWPPPPVDNWIHRLFRRLRAKDRAADAARRRERAAQRAAEYVAAYTPRPAPKLSRRRHGFRVTVECLDDGAKSSFITERTPFGLTISPSIAARKVACVLRNYTPAIT